MVAIQSQGGITNTYQLDSVGRPRQVVQSGTKTDTEVFHYAGGSDAPVWIDRGSSWTRNIGGIGGPGAIQDSATGTSLQLSNLHGDVVATASLSTTATGPTATFEFDEFGNPKQSSTPRFGWLGGKQRRTELPSGVIQMGVRSYVPAMGRDEAIQWAQEVAETGRIVDVVSKRRFLPRRFVTAFPESERAARQAAWAVPWTDGGAQPF